MKKFFTTKTIVGVALFAALGYAVSFLEFPIFPQASFLKLDFSLTFTALSGFAFGPIGGVIACVIKEGLCFITKSSTGGVGEIANAVVAISFIIIPSVVYRFKKGIPVVIITLAAGCCMQIAASLIVNRYVTFPMYMGGGAESAFNKLFWFIVAFNAIKSVAVSVLTMITYKRISYLLKMFDDGGKLKAKSEKSADKTSKTVISKGEEDTIKIAAEYAKTLKEGDVVLLEGELGAGKTAFVKGVASALGFDGVTSPTYAYLNVYGDYVYHYDCYRLSSGEDAENLGLTDYFNGANICLIEWAENIKDVLPDNCKKVIIKKLSDNEREIVL